MSQNTFVVSIKELDITQLATIEERAVERFTSMVALTPHMGNLTLSVAALVMEIVEELYPGNATKVYIVAQEDMRSIVRSYLKRWKLVQFPYKNGALLDYVSYADFTRVAACI